MPFKEVDIKKIINEKCKDNAFKREYEKANQKYQFKKKLIKIKKIIQIQILNITYFWGLTNYTENDYEKELLKLQNKKPF